MRNKSAFAVAIVIAVALVAAVTVVTAVRRQSDHTGPLEKIVVAAEPVPPASPLWVAHANGYFEEVGLQVEIREFASGRTALAAMVNGEEIDLATAAQTPVVSHSFGRNDYAIIAGMAHSDRDVKVLARRDRGVASPADLKGKTIGVTAGSSGDYFLSLLLAHNQMRRADLTVIDVEATELPRALIDGTTDAIVTWEPHVYRARNALGSTAALLPSLDIYREDFYFVARKAFLKSHSRAARRFLAAIERAEQLIHRSPRQAKSIVEQRLRMDPQELEATWGDFHFTLFLDQSVLVSLEDEARWAIVNEQRSETRVPNFLEFVDADALTSVKPEAVDLAGKGVEP